MSTASLVLDLIGRDRASREIDKVGDAMDRAGGKMSGLTKAAIAIGGITAITAFGVSSVRAFAEAEAAQNQLALAFTKFPALADTSIARLQDLNQAMQDKTAIDADSLAAADAVLARFELAGSEIEKLTPLLVDYSTVSGKTAPEAAETLGKALMGNVRALKALGIEFTPTGDRAADLASVMGLLEEKVGGAGEAFAQTAQGKIQALGVAFGDLQEAVGGALVPALSGLVNVVKPIADAFGALPEPVRATAIALAAVGVAAGVAGPKFQAMKAAVAEAGGVSALMKNNLGSVAGFLGGPWAAALAIGGAALWAFTAGQTEAAAKVQALTDALAQQGAAGELAAAKVIASNLQPYADDLARVGSSVEEATTAVLLGGDALDAYKTKLAGAEAPISGYAGAQNAAGQSTYALNIALDKNAAALDEAKSVNDAAAGATAAASAAQAEYATTLSDAEKAARKEADALEAVSDAFKKLQGLLDKREALRSWKEGLDDLSRSIKENGKDFGNTTEAGRANGRMLDDQVGQAIDLADTYKSSASKMAVFNKRLEEIKADLIASGISAPEANRLLAPYRQEFAASINYVKGLSGQAGAAGMAVGSAMGQGVVSGLNSKMEAVRAAAFGIAEAASRALHLAAQVSSPSRITVYIGEMFAEGLIVGLTSKVGATKEAADRWIEGLKQRIENRLDALKDKLDDAKDQLKSLREAYWSTLEAVQGDMRDFGSLTGFDLGAARSTSAAATAALAAEDQARAARDEAAGAVLLATTDEERARALERLAAAEKALTEATRARTEADTAAQEAAVTGDNLRKSMAARLQKMKDFAAALKELKGLGLNRVMLQELLDAGPVDGLEMAKAILDAGLDTVTGLNVAQEDLDTVSRDIGRFGANVAMPEFAAQVTQLQGQIATLQKDYTELARIQKVVAELHIDGRKLVETLLRYRREHGGVGLGLDG